MFSLEWNGQGVIFNQEQWPFLILINRIVIFFYTKQDLKFNLQ